MSSSRDQSRRAATGELGRRQWNRQEKADVYRTFDERKPLEPAYPSITPSTADFIADEARARRVYTSEEEALRFAPPG